MKHSAPPPLPPDSGSTLHRGRPFVFTFRQSAADDGTGYPIFVRRWPLQEATLMHEHVYHEVVIVESGTADHISSEGSRKLHMGDLIIIKPGVWHQYKNPQSFGIVNCLFDRRILIHQKMFFSLVGGAFELFGKPNRSKDFPPTFLHVNPSQRERIKHIVNSMIYERKEKLIDWEGALLVHLQDLIVLISRIHHGAYPREDNPMTPSVRDFFNDIIVYLEHRFREKMTLADLSLKFHVSPSYLSRVFKRRMGMGLIDYINHLRIEEACRLLRSTDWSITLVASNVGYDEIAYFSRRFRKQTGQSARDYRKSIVN